MDKKPKVSPSHTYILDEEDIEELDKLSLTSVVRSATIAEEIDRARLEASSSTDESEEDSQAAEEEQ